MEAVLQKAKSKKQQKKSKQSSKIELVAKNEADCDNIVTEEKIKPIKVNLEQPISSETAEPGCIENEAGCDNFMKKDVIKLQKIDLEELVKSSESIISPSVPPPEELSTNIVKNVENYSGDAEKDQVLISKKDNFSKVCDDAVFKSVTETPVSEVDIHSTETMVQQKNLCSYTETVMEPLKPPCDKMKINSLHLYPDLKTLEHCEKLHNILSSQTLVKTSVEQYRNKIAVDANKCFQDFIKTLEDLDNHPLMDMVDEFQRAKKSFLNFRSRLKYLKSDLKRKKDSLWKTVTKEVIAKGKCEDGYNVNVKRTYTIKELDQDRFNEVIKTLKEIEELLLSDAFHSYSEEVMQLRTDHYIHELVEHIKNEPNTGRGENSIPLKKCISVLFHSQRQNVQDGQYLSICQNWLKTLVSEMVQSGSFDDTLFVINHIIRCPSGIANWASELIQIPASIREAEASNLFHSDSAQHVLLALYLVLNPVPLKEFFLKNIKDSPLIDPADKFAVLDSEGEEEETFEMSKNFSDADILSLLNQIPVRSLYKHILLDDKEKEDSGKPEIKVLSDGEILKLFAYSTAIIDVLFKGLETYYSENFELLFETISNLIRHILLYISKYWTYHINRHNHFKSESQAVYDKLFFHIVYKIYNFEKLHVWKILPALPYDHISEKVFWNILWIFFSPGKSEEQIYSEKDVEIKIKDEVVQTALINHIKNLPVHDIYQLLNAIEKMIQSIHFSDNDFIKFSFYIIFKVSILEPSLYKILSNEGLIILKDIAERFPFLVSELLKNINENFDNIPDFQQCINLFTKLNILNWIPEDTDVQTISSWLLSSLNDEKKQLACLILKNLNWNYKKGSLFLPYELHKKIAVIVMEAYVKFDADNKNEGLVSKGVKQILQFTSMGNQGEEEKFVHWAWNILFSLKLHPLDRKHSPWVEVYDGYVEECNDVDLSSDFFQPLLSAYEKRHPSACYIMLIMSNEGRGLKGLLNGGLKCFSSLVEAEQYMAAIKSLYYILPFFVKNSDELLEKMEFIKALSNLITADLNVLSNITRKPVIGAVLHKVASVIKYQIYQAHESTVECAAPLLKLWIKILMKLMLLDNNASANLKHSAEQINFLLDVCVKISFLHDYMRDSVMDLFNTYCDPLNSAKSQPSSFWNRIGIFISDASQYPILNRSTIPEYPWLAWVILYSEMKQKNIEDLWCKVSCEMLKCTDGSSAQHIKKVSQGLKIDLECLPIYRWALQAVKTTVSHLVSPLIWQQFFLYFFQKFSIPNSEKFASIGIKYFRNSQYDWLLTKIKKHLADTENFYRNLAKPSEPDRTESSEVLKSEENVSFYSSMARIFHAFSLWIDDDSLHDPGICLSALEPKYCPEWLELVLNGDKHVWFVLISVPLLKEDINQKIHSWSFSNTNSDEVVKPLPEKEESLPDLMLRHTKRYETILPAVKAETISVIDLEKNENFSSKDEILYLIERNQSLIFDKAQYFCEQMKKLKQLNFNYINWIPQEYEIEDCEVTESKVCHKGNGKNCSGAAYFRLKIQKCKKNVRISEKIENNRADYVIVEDQLSKLPVKDLCISYLCIENCIRSLAKKINEVSDKDAEGYKKMGIALFYHQIKRIDQVIPTVAEYPPSRQFFSSVIELLGREFLDGADDELVNLVKSILNHPESGSLALSLFNPNKSSIDNFIKMFSTLASSIGKHSSSTLIALFSKIDLYQWLNEHTPSFESRKTIFKDICDALFQCGYHPSTELLPIFDILKRHFGIILKYIFPELFMPAVDFLLKGMEDDNLCTDVYYEAFNCFGCPLFNDQSSIEDIEYALKKFAQNQQLPADQKIFVSVAQLNFQQVSYVSHHLYDYFIKKRYSIELYKKYRPFIKPLGIFLAIISHSLIALHMDDILNEPLCTSELWTIFHLPFWPWLHPIADSSGLHFPWTDEELIDAHYMFKIFTMSFKYFHGQILNLESEISILSCIWLFYVERYVIPGYRHYSVSVCHTELLNLPWHEFHPGTQDIEGMCKVLQSNLHESKEFLSKISLKIPWCSVMQTISLTKPPDYVGKVLATLGKLLIISQLDCTENDDNLDLNVFKEMEGLSWQYVSMNDIEILLELAYSRLDPFLLVSNWNSGSEFHVLQFLKIICCMIPNPDARAYSNSKRILYLNKFISTLSSCCSTKLTQMTKLCHKLNDIIFSLLDEIRVIICHVASSNEQIIYALPLVKEVLLLLNGLPTGELDAAVLKSVTSWLSMNKTSPLLLPCLKISCQNLNSVSHIVHIIECCICTRFRDETLDSREAQNIWHLISSYFSLNPKIYEEFLKKCVKENAYLSLYCCLLHKLPQSESTESKKLLLEQIFSWIKESELRCDSEAKFILLWDKLLELSIKLIYEQEHQIVRYVLTSFCWTLENLALDRSNSGVFAMIGFGQASSLSVNFRFLCRVMVAYIQYQVPATKPIRIEPTDMEGLDSSITAFSTGDSLASKALENLKALQLKKLYSALHSQIEYATKCVTDPKYTFLQCREVLKYFAVVLYPKDSYLSSLDT